MDINLIVLAGTLAADPELRTFDSGSTLLRYLVTVRTDRPRRRVDVLPVTLWDPRPEHLEHRPQRGQHVFVVGSAQRRFWSASDGKTSRIEIIALDVSVREAGEGADEEDRATA